MEAYLKIYIKKDKVGHVRYELNDGRGYKEIRGLSVGKGKFLPKQSMKKVRRIVMKSAFMIRIIIYHQMKFL